NGVVGGITGAAEGIKRGVSSGSHSTPAAALALGALGVAGLIEWPVLLAVGGGALLLHRIQHKPATPTSAKASLTPVPSTPSAPSAPATKKAAPQKSASKSTAKKTSGRRAGSATLRSTN
ncbi:hypothetical protein, partial [Mycobacterium palustre]